MAGNNPSNMTNTPTAQQMPMGSHATAGGPHPTMGQQTPMPQAPVQQAPMQPTVIPKPPMQQLPAVQPSVPIAPMVATPQISGAGPVNFDVLGPAPVMSTEYTQGYLKSQIGKKVLVSFLIGADNYTDRQGTLVHVGISYIIIQEAETNNLMLCDIYSIKFVRFYY